MILVSDIYPDAKKLLGNCSDTLIFRAINRAVEVLANKSDWDPLLGYMDLATDETTAALPREVETPIAVSYGNYPALGRDQLFRFHLNGPGDQDIQGTWRWWEDAPESVTARDLDEAAAVAAIATDATDIGREVWVYGYDEDDQPIRTEIDGEMTDGYRIILATSFTADPDAPVFARITRVKKPETTGSVKLWSVASAALDTLLAVYSWDDTEPVFRRIRFDRASDTIRIFYRRRNFAVRSQTDLIPLHSQMAVVMMIKALRAYDDNQFDIAMAAEATAMRWLVEEQQTRNPSLPMPIQVLDRPSCDFLE